MTRKQYYLPFFFNARALWRSSSLETGFPCLSSLSQGTLASSVRKGLVQPGGNLDVSITGMAGNYMFSFCNRIASLMSFSASSFDTGFDMVRRDFQTFSLSSWVLAWANGLRSFPFVSIQQIYANTLNLSNNTALIHLHPQPLVVKSVVSSVQFWRQLTGSSFLSYSHKQWYSSLSVDNPLKDSICALDYSIQTLLLFEKSHQGNHLDREIVVRNQDPWVKRNQLKTGEFPRFIKSSLVRLKRRMVLTKNKFQFHISGFSKYQLCNNWSEINSNNKE